MDLILLMFFKCVSLSLFILLGSIQHSIFSYRLCKGQSIYCWSYSVPTKIDFFATLSEISFYPFLNLTIIQNEQIKIVEILCRNSTKHDFSTKHAKNMKTCRIYKKNMKKHENMPNCTMGVNIG